METTKEIIISLLFVTALAIFTYGFIKAIIISLKRTKPSEQGKPDEPIEELAPVLNTTLLHIIAVLSTNFGAIVGNLASYGSTSQFNIYNEISSSDKIRLAACLFYFLCLIISFVVYAINGLDGNNKKPTVPIIINLALSLLGVVVGALAVVLGTKPNAV